jgi:hypothetical protein
MNLNMNTTSACNDMLFASAKPAPLHKDKPVANVAPPASAAPPTTAAPGVVDAGPPAINRQFGPDDMQGLLEHWGQANSRYDLNADGTVDVDDLIAMIANWQAAPDNPPSTDPVMPSGDSTPVLSPAKIEPATGERTPSVDVVATSSPDSPVADTASEPITEPAPAPDPLDKLVGAWGQPATEYDFDGNGVIDADDLIHMILNWGSPTPPAATAASAAVPPTNIATDALTTEAASIDKPARHRTADDVAADRADKPRLHDRDRHGRALSPHALAKVTESLVDRLMSAGFTDRPPADLRDIVDSLKLTPGDTKSVMRSLRKAYPGGLGVNVRV